MTYFGKYRGVVSDNKDPETRGRIKAQVPDVLGDRDSTWAMPCVPYGGDGVGWYFVPPIDASVWIEFEQGDPNYPVWVGCSEPPAKFLTPGTKMLKTGSAAITIKDQEGSGSLTLVVNNSAKIVMDSNGIEITNGQGASIKLSGATVKINEQALEVT
jgi:uncharacterized protein involved in type VI secretion and phage assembly